MGPAGGNYGWIINSGNRVMNEKCPEFLTTPHRTLYRSGNLRPAVIQGEGGSEKETSGVEALRCFFPGIHIEFEFSSTLRSPE